MAMITRRMFLTMSSMFATVLVLFLGTTEAHDLQVSSGERVPPKGPGSAGGDFDVREVDDIAELSERDVVFVGRSQVLERTAEEWCRLGRRHLVSALRAEDLQGKSIAAMVLVQGSELSENGVDALCSLADRGNTIVFMDLPPASFVESQWRLSGLLGVREVRDNSVRIDGYHLFSGFLLGGETIYGTTAREEKLQDLSLSIPWYVTLDGCETYMVGMMGENLDDEDQNQYLPAVIWRCGLRKGNVFAVNGDFMQDDLAGMGILSAMQYAGSDYVVQPVVNAQVFSVLDFPGSEDGNERRMSEVYGRSQTGVQQKIMYPSLSTLMADTDTVMTDLWSGDDSSQLYRDSLRELGETSGEMGISFRQGTSSVHHDFLTAYAPDSSPLPQSVRTRVLPQASGEDVVSYVSDDVTGQRVTSVPSEFTYSADLALKGSETMLAYAGAMLDGHKPLWPKTTDDEWQNYFRRVSANYATYWKPFSSFSRVSASEADARIRTFLHIDLGVEEKDGSVCLASGVSDPSYYLLRTHGSKPVGVTGGSVTQIEKDAWLLRMEGSSMSFKWREEAQ